MIIAIIFMSVLAFGAGMLSGFNHADSKLKLKVWITTKNKSIFLQKRSTTVLYCIPVSYHSHL